MLNVNDLKTEVKEIQTILSLEIVIVKPAKLSSATTTTLTKVGPHRSEEEANYVDE